MWKFHSVGYTRFDFSTIKRQFSLPFYDEALVDDHVFADVLVGVDLLEVDDHELVDDRGVAVPGQVDGVCRYPL